MSFRDRIQRALATRVDSWANTLIGVGSALGKTDFRFRLSGGEFLSLVDLENLYNFDGIAARVVDAVPKHALRHGFTVSTGDATTETAIGEALAALHVVETTRLAWTWGRGFGGGAIYLGADDGRAPDEPLDEDNLRSLDWITDVDRRDLYPMTWVSDPRRGDFGQPRTYRLTRMGGTATESVTVHASRIIRFEGPAPTRRRRLQLQGWGDSVLQRVYAELQAARAAFAASGVLLQEASQGVLKIKDLMSMMASDTDDTMKRRLELMDQGRSVARALLLDADGESFERVEVGSLTGVVDVMDRMINMVAATSNTPVTVLMGQAPAGLNATGDSDIANWDDEVLAERTLMADPKVRRVVQLLLRSKNGPTGGKEPKGWKTVYPPLRQATPSQQADLRNKQANTDALYIDKGVLTPEEVATSRFRREGWSDDTSIDLDAREAAMDADEAATANPTGGADASAALDIIAKVAAREIPRDAGVALLVSNMGMEAEAAEAAMGEAGRGFFTTADPNDTAAHEALKAEHAKLQASARGTQQMLTRVLERNRAGELVVGNVIGKAPTELKEGEALAEGDVVEVPVEDSAWSIRTDGGNGGVAVVLPLSPFLASMIPTQFPAADLHVTLAYLGRADEAPLNAPDALVTIERVVRAWAAQTPALRATLAGVERFPLGPDGIPVYIAVRDPVALNVARRGLVDALAAAGFPARSEHAFVPHVTIAYVEPGAQEPLDTWAPVPVEFNRASVWCGETRVNVDLTGGA